jgi:hypothetical protein
MASGLRRHPAMAVGLAQVTASPDAVTPAKPAAGRTQLL